MKATICTFLALLLTGTGFSQSTKLILRIVDEVSNRDLYGATIKDQNGIVLGYSNEDGNLTLYNKDKITVLKVSFGGYQEMEISNFSVNKPNTVKLKKKVLLLDTISVSTGYQKIPRERMTGSFAIIGEKEINRTYTQDILSRLENMTTGLHFSNRGASFDDIGRPSDRVLTVHGISTLRNGEGTGNMPLIILDNFPYEGDLNGINPNDVESISILKDAASASIWGAKAGNGVIVITTKRAQLGKKLNISARLNTQLSDRPNLYANRVISPKDYIEIEKSLFAKGFYKASENDPAHPALSPVVELLIQNRDGLISEKELENKLHILGKQDVRNDFLKYMYQRSVQNQFAFNLGSGNDRQAFNLGIGYDRSLPLIINNVNDRFSLNVSNTLQMGKTSLRTKLRWMTYRDDKTPSTQIYGDSGYRYPYIKLRGEDGNSLAVPNDYRLSYLADPKNNVLLDWGYRPIEEVRKATDKMKINELQFDFGLEHKITDWLQLDVMYQIAKSINSNNNLYSIGAYNTRNRINRGSELVDGNIKYNFPFGGVLERSEASSLRHNVRTMLALQREFGENHTVNAILGVDINQQNNKSNGNITYGYDDQNLTYATVVDHNFYYRVWDNLGGYENVPYPILPSSDLTNRFISIYTNGAYSYKKRYSLSFSARKDASNVFGVEANNRWTPLWSLGGMWNIAEEPFLKNKKWHLKIRATHGVSGNMDNSMSSQTIISYGINPTTYLVNYPKASITVFPNPNLRWEKVKNTNIGIDLDLVPALSISLDLYWKRTKDLLHTYPMDPTLGLLSQVMNVATTKSRGIDLVIRGKVEGKKLSWNPVLNLSYNNNWITKTYVPYRSPNNLILSTMSQIEGTIAFPLYSYRWAGLDPETGQARGFINGEVSKNYRAMTSNAVRMDELVYHGSTRPLVFGNLLNSFRLKNWNLSFNLAGQFDYYFRRSSISYVGLVNSGKVHSDYYDRWQNSGDELMTDIPAFVYPMDGSDRFYQYNEKLAVRGDHIRLKDVRIGMDFKLPGNTGKIEAFAVCSNLGILWRANKFGLDPQVNGRIPMPRLYSFGLNYNY